ncbi:hypothetical protein [Phycicoccus sonneratiae]|uniref:Excreted virulence factor EspC, type VII ESX diderm n=1 Tax=Phycicoccus sonneratiae TaxID=2807628 RepID=A0ABS2CGK2_9MICO|nr:hypothetical protein [Phycicoccus sonneraticus]MBM6398991.1 hypothetical protein [Phycicoccus sonneraticus]
MSYEVEREALLTAAGTWESAEADMRTAQSTARGISVTTIDASIIAEMVGFTSTYAEVRDRVVDLLGQAAEAMRLVDDTLEDIEKQYRLDDDSALARIGDAWSPTNP